MYTYKLAVVFFNVWIKNIFSKFTSLEIKNPRVRG